MQSNIGEHRSADCIHEVISNAFRIEPVELMSNVRDENEKCSNERNTLDEDSWFHLVMLWLPDRVRSEETPRAVG